MTVLSALLMAAGGALCSVESVSQPAVVVELYTSQGCSSCPPADRWLGTLRERYGERVIPLSMHVGYWDYIGWKDPFARREFNDRQRLLATSNGSRTVYTPGVFVQGRELPDWSRRDRFDAAVQTARQDAGAPKMAVAIDAITPTAVSVRIRGDAPAATRLWLALVQDGLATDVKAGENRGERLRNHHVVRDWREANRGQAQTLQFPAGPAPNLADWTVVGLLDDERGRTLQAVRLPLVGCAAAPAR